jgi:hypothetical protein
MSAQSSPCPSWQRSSPEAIASRSARSWIRTRRRSSRVFRSKGLQQRPKMVVVGHVRGRLANKPEMRS